MVLAPPVGSVDAHCVLARAWPGLGPAHLLQGITGGGFVSTDMAVQNFVGDAFRGATWVALHNGGGVGW